MAEQFQWQVPNAHPPDRFVKAVQQAAPTIKGDRLASLLWQRGICQADQLAGFLDASQYQPASPFEFGEEMQVAMQRLQHAIAHEEIVAIWGDFDADGVTATAVLWEGLGQFFRQQKTLFYYIPNRLIESHGLSRSGLDQLKAKGCQLIITCDTGSTNLAELEYANQSGMDVIVTDHHTLPDDRPPVTAIISPRSLPSTHPLATLSGVAVAYKLVEALYETFPNLPQKPLEDLLDLVAIGLIADLVELKGDCRYLAQRGIEQLQKQGNPTTATRPGVAKLLEFCKRNGDRPTDISFGLGPRINAVSRIQGDAHFCVELLTSRDAHLCTHLAEATELANARRKALQKDVLRQVSDRVAQLDLSTTNVIVLMDDQWQPGVLGLVAGQIAQDYGKPTILLSTEGWSQPSAISRDEMNSPPAITPHPFTQTSQPTTHHSTLSPFPLAKGSARSLPTIDLYQLVKGQEHLLYRFGGHPFAAGLSLPVDNVPLFTEAINQQLRQTGKDAIAPTLMADLIVTLNELGKDLFQELKLLEPCGIGNPVPRLLIQNCWFTNVKNNKIRDRRGQKIEYIKSEFELWDESCQQGFPGIWWGHYRDEFPSDRADAIVELDFNAYAKRYEVRIMALRLHAELAIDNATVADTWLLDWRQGNGSQSNVCDRPALILYTPPASWTELYHWLRQAWQDQQPLAIAFTDLPAANPMDIWQQLVGIAKYLSRTGLLATRQQLCNKLAISDRALQKGLETLIHLGFELKQSTDTIQIQPGTIAASASASASSKLQDSVQQFVLTIQEEQFRRQYFAQLPFDTLQAIATQNLTCIDQGAAYN